MIKMKLKNILILCFFSCSLKGQIACFTEVNIERSEKVERLLQQVSLNKNYDETSPMVRLAIHNITRTDGTGGFDWNDIHHLIDLLPDIYSPLDICFTVVYEGDINNDNYHDIGTIGGRISTDWRYNQLVKSTVIRVDNAINIFFINGFEGAMSTGPIGGVTAFPTIVIGDEDVYGSPSYGHPGLLAHELGHCFGLYHTHETIFGIEHPLRPGETYQQIPPPVCTPEINCSTHGDKLCDTEADDNLYYSVKNNAYVESTCSLTSVRKLCGINYRPDTRNIMSYAPISCQTNFSQGQINRMRNLILHTNLSDNYVIRENITLTGTSSSNRYYGTENSITSSVEHTSGEVIYQASNEIKLQNGFKLTADANTSFHAKLGTYSCSDPLVTNHGKMTKGNNSDIPTEDAVFDFKMYPNPTEAIFTMDLFFVEDEAVTITITDIMGKVYLVQNRTLTGDTNHKFEVNVAPFGKGIYFVNVRTAKHFKTRKLVVE
jgi:hypothetical protein